MSPLFSTFSSGGGGRGRGFGFGRPLRVSAAPPGEAVFTTVQSHTWTVPEGVESVCVVCVGGGGAGDSYYGGGGGGGALAWKNNIAVTPGTTATIVVGGGGVEGTAGYMPSGQEYGPDKGASYQGKPSSFTYGSTAVIAEGGAAGSDNPTTSYGIGPAATFSGADGCGNGGVSCGGYGSQPTGWTYNYSGAGGGGAGGYDGAGGEGGAGARYNITPGHLEGYAGSGGGGGGGGSQETNHPTAVGYGGAGGGGVGLYGEGASGAGGDARGNDAMGKGGSGGQNGTLGPNNANGGIGGLYGGGGGTSHGSNGVSQGGSGGQGAVRIIWGDGRSFPITLTAESDSETIDTY